MTRIRSSRFTSSKKTAAAFLFLLLSVFCFLAAEGRATAQNPPLLPADDTVRISILSKSLRQLREQSLKKIPITFPDRTTLFNKTTGEVAALRQINIVWTEGRFHIQREGKPDLPLRRGTFHSSIPGAVFTMRIGDEKRFYPLPLEVMELNGDIVFVIEESKSRYALDAARAELGSVPEKQQEALYALGLLILSRIEMRPSESPHRGFDFCDLTHCQVYTGRRVDDDPSFAASARIDNRRLSGPLHFHARCGGRTLGARVFSLSAETEPGVSDLITQRGVYLCSRNAPEWEASLSARELGHIVCAGNRTSDIPQASVEYDIDRLIVSVSCGESVQEMAPEDFRLKLNRVRGWNFLPSNAYEIRQSDSAGELRFIFKGRGLGHGAGLCQTGALKLASLGYSRYDILRHYFPGIGFTPVANGNTGTSPDVSYLLFSLKTGKIEQASHTAFIERQIPSGSIFKLVVALYLAARQPSFLNEYSFRCPDGADADMPGRCWLSGGHGQVGFQKALSHSCNLYFASLHRHIPQDQFFSFFHRLRLAANLSAELPDIQTRREYARLLSGLDARVLFSIRDLVALTQTVSPAESDQPEIESFKLSIPPCSRAAISEALIKTMKDGTGSQPLKHRPQTCRTLWGKTATVSDGTNRPAHCGIFIGGCDETGIIVIRKSAVGRDAAQSAVAIFGDYSKNK